MRAACERTALAALALGSVVLAHAAWPRDSLARAEALVVGVLALGYGHLLGAAWLAWPRLRQAAPRHVPGPVFALWLGTGALAALAVYGWAAARAPWLPLALLALSVWHTVENDLALFDRGGLPDAAPPRLAPGPRRALALAWTLAFGVLATATPAWREGLGADASRLVGLILRAGALGASAIAALRGTATLRLGAAVPAAVALLPAPPLALVDLFAASTLYHLYTWLGVLGRRIGALRAARRRADARRLGTRVAAVHVLPATLCVALALAPEARWPELRAWLLGPGLYLFWSALHVVQTAWTRPASPLGPGSPT